MDRDAEFVDLLVTSQVPLRAFAVSLVGNTQDADDVLQSASIVLWQKRAAFLRGSDFFRCRLSSGYSSCHSIRHICRRCIKYKRLIE